MDALTRGTDAPKLSVRDCCKRFTGAPVLDHVSFDVASGEFLSVLGPSGCGKTTLLRILAGLESPDAGSVLKDGADITRLPPERRSMGLVFQDYALFENMTVRQNVRYALRFHPQLRAQADERTDGLLGWTACTARSLPVSPADSGSAWRWHGRSRSSRRSSSSTSRWPRSTPRRA